MNLHEEIAAADALNAAYKARIAELETKVESAERRFIMACEDLGLINEKLGLDPDDGGAEPIIAAIEELQAAALAPKIAGLDGVMNVKIGDKEVYSADELLARILPPAGLKNHIVIEREGKLMWCLRENLRPDDGICFYDGDLRKVAMPDAAPPTSPVTYGPDNPPRLRKPGESVEEYRAAMGWASTPLPADTDKLREASAWEALRADVLHGVDGLDNDQVNTVLGMIDYYMPTASTALQAHVREVPENSEK